MEIVFSNGKKHKLPNPTFEVMRRAGELLSEYEAGRFLHDNFIVDDIDTLKEFVLLAFQGAFTEKEFDTLYAPDDLSDFIEMGKEILHTVFINPKKIEVMGQMVQQASEVFKIE